MSIGNTTLDENIYNRVKDLMSSDGVTFKLKTKSKLMKLIGFLLFFNKSFMSSYYTTIGNTVYIPRVISQPEYSNYRTFIHEYQHVKDYRNHYPFLPRLFFICSYLSPQLSAIVSILASLSIFTGNYWFLLSFVFILFLLPIRSKGRTTLEIRGYAMNIAIHYKRFGSFPSEKYTKTIVDKFIGGDYYYMWDDEESVKEELLSLANKLVFNSAFVKSNFPHLIPIYNIIQEEKEKHAIHSKAAISKPEEVHS